MSRPLCIAVLAVSAALLLSCTAERSNGERRQRSFGESKRNDGQEASEDKFAQIADSLQRQQNEIEELRQLMLQHLHNGTEKEISTVDYTEATDCSDILRIAPGSASGVYAIRGSGPPTGLMRVYCDMTTSGGGWTVFQRRQDGSENFYRPWDDYVAGFGRLTGEFWLGNDILAALTSSKRYRLRVDLEDWDSRTPYAEYSDFKVGDASTNYTLVSLGSFGGRIGYSGDSMSMHLGMQFSTYDRDNDAAIWGNCAEARHGAWWYENCHDSNLNGEYNNTSYGRGINWGESYKYKYSMKFTEMKIRPADL